MFDYVGVSPAWCVPVPWFRDGSASRSTRRRHAAPRHPGTCPEASRPTRRHVVRFRYGPARGSRLRARLDQPGPGASVRCADGRRHPDRTRLHRREGRHDDGPATSARGALGGARGRHGRRGHPRPSRPFRARPHRKRRLTAHAGQPDLDRQVEPRRPDGPAARRGRALKGDGPTWTHPSSRTSPDRRSGTSEGRVSVEKTVVN